VRNTVLIAERCNLNLDKGPADYDARHRFTFGGTYAIPFARDNAYIGGWNVNAVYIFQTGTPFTVYSGNKRADRSTDPGAGHKAADCSNGL